MLLANQSDLMAHLIPHLEELVKASFLPGKSWLEIDEVLQAEIQHIQEELARV